MASMTIRDTFNKAGRDTYRAAKNYWLNSAFLAGHQWLFVPDDMNGQIRELPKTDRIQMVDNRIAANHRTIMANATQRNLEFDVRPNGADDASQQSAHVAKEVCYHLRDDHNWEGLREELLVAMLKGGTAAIALDWDEANLDTVDTPLTIADFVVEPGSKDPERARWWIKAQMLPPGDVQAMYGLSEPPPADATAGLNPFSRQLVHGHTGQGDQQSNDLTLVLTYYERPNGIGDQETEGRVAVEINRQIVQDQPWPFPFKDKLNLSVGTETKVENRWFGDTTYTHARSPQVALNYVQSNLSEHLRDSSIARLLVPHSAVHLMEALDDVPGNMYPYPDGSKTPEWLQPPQLPAWLRELANNYRASIDDAMGVHDVTRGRAPANLESGTAISILAEMDGSPVGRLMKEIGRMFSNHAKLSLMLHEKQAPNKNRFAMVETGAGPLALDWKGKDIGGQYNVHVPLDSIMPRSSAAQLQVATKMLEMGIISTMAEFIRFAEAPGHREILDVMEPAVAKARRNHTAITQGEPVIPAEFDDYATLIAEGNKFRMTPAYERMDEENQEIMDLYMQACETLAAEQAAKMAGRQEMSAALGAAPTADGAPSAPPVEGLPPEAPADIVEPQPADLLDQLTAEL